MSSTFQLTTAPAVSSVRLIALDIDGTLLPSASGITPRTMEALHRAVAAGIHVVIATGRRHRYAVPIIAPVGLDPETICITSNGAVTRTLAGRLISRTIMPVPTALAVCEHLHDFKDTLVFTFDREAADPNVVYLDAETLQVESLDSSRDPSSPDFRLAPSAEPHAPALVVQDMTSLHRSIRRWVEVNSTDILQINPIERAFDQGEAPVQAMVCGTLAHMATAFARLNDGSPSALRLADEIAVHHTDYPARDLSIVDLLPAECSKGTALARVAASLGIPREEVMAIGDNGNDLDMLEFAGHPVIMENSGPEALAAAARHGWPKTASNDAHGVAITIERVLSQQAPVDRED